MRVLGRVSTSACSRTGILRLVCVIDPRISLAGLKLHVRAVGHCSNGHVRARLGHRWGARLGILGGCYTGYPASGTTQLTHIGIARTQPLTCSTLLRPPRHSRPAAQALRTPWLPALKMARSRDLFPKVSHKSGVSPKMSHEACHAPYLRNPLKCHDLEFLRFSISLAFSHKE